MTIAEITPDQCKAARAALGISQAFVAKTAGINRSQLALFEVGKYRLENYKLLALRKCYETLGYTFDGQTSSQPPAAQADVNPTPIPVAPAEVAELPIATLPETSAEAPPLTIENLVVSGDFDQDDIQYILSEIQWNDHLIETLIDAPVKLHWWTEEPITKERDAIIRVMARNYQLVRSLQSEEILPAPTGASGDNATPATAGALASALLESDLTESAD